MKSLSLLLVLVALVLLHAMPAESANVTLLTSDLFSGNESSFDASLANGNHWSNNQVPMSGNNYFTGNFVLRTPANGSSYTFAGDSLTINNTNGFNDGGLFYKGTGNTGVITVNNLVLNGGSITHQSGTNDVFQLAGNMNVASNSRLYARQGAINVSAVISGSATITNPGSDGPGRTLTFLSPNNTFSGNLVNNGRFQLAHNALMNFVIGSNGVNNSISGTGAETIFNGDFNFDLTSASSNSGDNWTIVSATNQSFGSSFTVPDFTEVTPGTWQKDVYQFSEATGVLSVVAPLELLTLRVNTATGEVSIRNSNAATTFDMNYYEIHSPSGSLDYLNGWTSIDGDIPASTTTWEKAGGSSAYLISETNLFGMESLGPSESASLGTPFAGTLQEHQDLVFKYSTTSASSALFTGIVEYVGLLGDYNGNGAVDAADYVVWRKNPANYGGDPEGYNTWRTNFGQTIGSGSAVSMTVPEPASVWLLILSAAIGIWKGHRIASRVPSTR